MQFKHKDLLNEFNRQVQSGEYERGWWEWEFCYRYKNWMKIPSTESPGWDANAEYRFSKTEKHPDNALLDVGDVVKSLYFTAVIAKIEADDNTPEKYFAVITGNIGTAGRPGTDCIGQLLDSSTGSRQQITEFFDSYKVIKNQNKK